MWDNVGAKNWRRPLLLRADNFTPPQRTPWGGRRIVERLKKALKLDVQGPVGEAWELSVEPDFPSRLAEGPSLEEVLREDPTLLGREASAGSTALLVKLVDTADELSLQIHPRDDDPALGEDESGKPEAWYIVGAEPGAGLYLGFREGVSRSEVTRALQSAAPLDALMTFVPVSVGDVFLIEPGTAHAIGRGVLLLEPQRVTPGKRGVTYRYWDWNRRYDEAGHLDPGGKPRTLHVERALDVTDWDGPRGEALVERIHYAAGAPDVDGAGRIRVLAGPDGPLRSTTFDLRRLCGSGSVRLEADDRLRGLTVFEGSIRAGDGEDALVVDKGRTAALPATGHALDLELDRAHAVLSALA